MGDATYFIADKTYDLLKNETIRSQCLVMISSLIEVFGDDAINALLLVLQRMFAAELINKQEEIKVKELVEESNNLLIATFNCEDEIIKQKFHNKYQITKNKKFHNK